MHESMREILRNETPYNDNLLLPTTVISDIIRKSFVCDCCNARSLFPAYKITAYILSENCESYDLSYCEFCIYDVDIGQQCDICNSSIDYMIEEYQQYITDTRNPLTDCGKSVRRRPRIYSMPYNMDSETFVYIYVYHAEKSLKTIRVADIVKYEIDSDSPITVFCRNCPQRNESIVNLLFTM